MAIRILTEEDKRELEQAIAEAAQTGGTEVDVAIRAIAPVTDDNMNPNGFTVIEGSLEQAWRKAYDLGKEPVVALSYTGGSVEGSLWTFYEPVHITINDNNDPEESRIVLDFSCRQSGNLYSCSLISQGESNIANNRFTGFECTVLQEGSGSSADLTGYATEDWVRAYVDEEILGGEW